MLATQPFDAKPGVVADYQGAPIDIFYSGREAVKYMAAPLTVDGTLTNNPLNSPFQYWIFAGTLMGRVTSTKKYANSIIGPTNSAYTSGGTTLVASANTVAEVVRRFGSSGTFTLLGPATAGGVIASPNQVVTYSAASGTSITITSTGINYVSGSLIMPNDGSQNVITVSCGIYGFKVTDATNINRLDVGNAQLLLQGGTLNDQALQQWPADASIIAYLKAAITKYCSGTTFLSDTTG